MLVLHGAKERVEVLQFSPDGRGLAAPCAGNVHFWADLTAGGPATAVLTYRYYARSARFTPDGRKLLVSMAWTPAALHDLSTRLAVEVPPNLSRAEAFYELTPDGRAVVTALNQYGGRPSVSCRPLDDPESPAWVADTARPAYAPPLFLEGGGQFVLFEGEPDRVPFWYATRDAQTGQLTAEVMGSGQQYHSPVTSADRRLVAARKGNQAAVFRADDFAAGPVVVIRNDSRREFTGLAFHPSGRYLAATSNDATVKLYDTSTWKMAGAFDWDIGRLRSVAFSPDGTLAAAGGDKGKIVVWDVDL